MESHRLGPFKWLNVVLLERRPDSDVHHADSGSATSTHNVCQVVIIIIIIMGGLLARLDLINIPITRAEVLVIVVLFLTNQKFTF